ncbi:MAG: conjugal transfer protein TraF, partial [Marinospirillum sp.]|uniref:conjugal transfer protein TraF n=1 Tax=Marinospirillum sp. TaxID=2183934 RepID=UPI0019F82E37
LPFAAVTASANQSLVSPGYSSTIGGVSNQGTVHSSSNNPASNNTLVREGERIRFGYLSNFGGYFEIGESDDLDGKVNDLVDDMDAADSDSFNEAYLQQRYPSVDTTDMSDSEKEAAYFEAIANRANTELVADLEKGGQFRAGFQLQAPLTPFLVRSKKARGTFSINASASTQIRGGFIGSPFGVKTTFKDVQVDGVATDVPLNLDLGKAAGAYTEIDKVLNDSPDGTTESQKITDIIVIAERNGLIAGNDKAINTLIESYNITASDVDGLSDDQKKSLALQGVNVPGYTLEQASVQPAQTTTGITTKNELTTNSGFDIKAAAITHLGVGYGTNLSEWFELNRKHGELEMGLRANLYQVEAGRNFISIQAESNAKGDDDAFDKATEDFFENTAKTTAVGVDLGFLWHSEHYQVGLTFYNLNEPTIDYPNMADYLEGETLAAIQGLEQAGKTKVTDSVTLTRHAVIEGAMYSANRNWMVQGSYTLGTATNFVGDEFQTMAVSAGYFPKSWWAPGLRAGYSQNLVGAELSKVHLGMTMFGSLHLDMAASLDSSSFDGNDIPRYVGFSLGFEEKF